MTRGHKRSSWAYGSAELKYQRYVYSRYTGGGGGTFYQLQAVQQ